jgi:succinate dehydrogenase/fumarate reductase flavoprotein subunit
MPGSDDTPARADGEPTVSGTHDLVVVGSGAAGLAAAVTAVVHGRRVVVLEKTDTLGGTTATSGGEVWIPRSRQAVAAGVDDAADRVADYVREAAGAHFDAARTSAFIAAAPEALAFLETHSHLRYALMRGSPDYHSSRNGASEGGRSLAVEPFDGSRLGAEFRHVRPPLDNALIAGGVSVCTRLDVPMLLDAGRDVRAAAYSAQLIARGWRDRALGHRRGRRMTNGNALVGRLLLTLIEAGVEIRRNCAVTSLQWSDGRVTGVHAQSAGRGEYFGARDGVILATGGFSGSAELKRRFFPHVARQGRHLSLPPRGNEGDALRLAAAVGAGVVTELAAPAAWTPVSLVPNGRSPPAPWPHFGDKGKPGVIAVTANGMRFVNESESYHAFVDALLRQPHGAEHAYLIADHRAVRRYGLGAVRPAPWPVSKHLRSGYLRKAATLRELAQSIGIDPDALERTVTAFNAHAVRGDDPAFGRGATLFNRKSGDPRWEPNPALAPLVDAPFYAVRVEPGDIGTFVGLRTDADARVLDTRGAAIPGLYAAGNDAVSLFGGDYPAAGITLGPALTFGHLAALHAHRAASG